MLNYVYELKQTSEKSTDNDKISEREEQVQWVIHETCMNMYRIKIHWLKQNHILKKLYYIVLPNYKIRFFPLIFGRFYFFSVILFFFVIILIRIIYEFIFVGDDSSAIHTKFEWDKWYRWKKMSVPTKRK